MSTWSIRRYSGPPVPERVSAAEQKVIRKDTGVVLQRPGVPGPVVFDPSGNAVLAISGDSEVLFARKGPPTSTAEVLVPAPPDTSWPATGRIRHDGLGWTDWRHDALDGTLLGTGDRGTGRQREWGLWGDAVVTVGAERYTLDDLVRPESDEERARRERRRFFRSEKLAGRALGQRFVAADGSEAGRLTWVGDTQPNHHDHPYEWRLDWAAGQPDEPLLVATTACALRFMAYVGTMLSTS